MACSEDLSLGKYLEAIAKAFNACKKINKIGVAVRRAEEELKNTQNDTDVINVTLPSIREFRDVIGSCIDIAESLNGNITDIAREHAECIKDLKEITKSRELSNQQVENIAGSLNKLVKNVEQFGQKLHDFIKCTNDLQNVSVRVKNEATREAEKVKKETSSSRSRARWSSFCQWTARFATGGLITLSSNFQKSVEANNDRHQRAEELDGISNKFIEAKQLLDIAVRTTDYVAKQLGGESVKLTEDVIETIQSVLKQYQQFAHAQEMVLQKENIIIEKDKEIEEKNDEIERLNRQLELASNQGLKTQTSENEQLEALEEKYQYDPVLKAQKDENERLKRQLEELTKNEEGSPAT